MTRYITRFTAEIVDISIPKDMLAETVFSVIFNFPLRAIVWEFCGIRANFNL